MERVIEEGDLPLPRNAAGISASPAMPRQSSHTNGVVDFPLARAWPCRNCQTGRSSGACPMGALRPVLCKRATEPREPNGPKNVGPMRAKGFPSYQTHPNSILFSGLAIPAAGGEDPATGGAGVDRAAPTRATPPCAMPLLVLFVSRHGMLVLVKLGTGRAVVAGRRGSRRLGISGR
jgi:hypothetical protein